MAATAAKMVQLSLVALLASAVILPTTLARPDWNDFPSLHRPWPELLSAHGALAVARDFWAVIGPGGKLHPAYFLEHKGHLVIEGLLLAAILYLVLQQSFKVHRKAEEPLTDKVRTEGSRSRQRRTSRRAFGLTVRPVPACAGGAAADPRVAAGAARAGAVGGGAPARRARHHGVSLGV